MENDEPIWMFMEYTSFGGSGVITKWVDKKIEISAKDEFHDMLNFLKNVERELWTRPEYAPFDPSISELRWNDGGLQHRVFGFFLFEVKQYVMVIGSTKKGKIYTPQNTIQTAKDRKKEVLKDKHLITEYIWK